MLLPWQRDLVRMKDRPFLTAALVFCRPSLVPSLAAFTSLCIYSTSTIFTSATYTIKLHIHFQKHSFCFHNAMNQHHCDLDLNKTCKINEVCSISEQTDNGKMLHWHQMTDGYMREPKHGINRDNEHNWSSAVSLIVEPWHETSTFVYQNLCNF